MKLLLLNFLLNSGNQPLGEMSTSNCAGSNRIFKGQFHSSRYRFSDHRFSVVAYYTSKIKGSETYDQ